MIKILAVDDQYNNLISLEGTVKDVFPDSVLFAALKGREAIELAIAKDPDVILLDTETHDVNAFDVCQWIKQDKRIQDIPVIFLTSLNGNKKSRIKALEAGAEAFLSKPIDQAEFIAQIRAMIKIKTVNRGEKEEKERLARPLAGRTSELELTQKHTLRLEDLKTEVEERKKSETALRESEERFIHLFEKAPLAYQSLDSEGYIIAVNEAWLSLFEYKYDQVIGRCFGDFLGEGYVEAFRRKFSQFKAEGQVHAEFQVSRKSGELRFIAIDGSVGHKKDGSFDKTYCILQDITEKKRSEEEQKKTIEALLKSEEKYRTLVEISQDAIFINYENRIIYLNPAAIKLFGATRPDQVIDKAPLEFFHPDFHELIKARIDGMLFKRLIVPLTEEKIVRLDGKVVDVEVSATPFNYKDGLAIQVVLRDITERKKTEAALKEKNTFIQTVLENLPIGIALNTIDQGQNIYSNKKFEEIYGWPPEDLTDIATFFQKVYPDDVYRNQLMATVMADIQSGDPSRMHWENCHVTHKDGSKHFINAVNIPLWDQNTMVSTVIDMTETKKAEDSLRLSEENYRRVIDNVDEIIYLVTFKNGGSLDGNVNFVSKQAEKILGYTSEEFIQNSQLWLTVIHPDDRERVAEETTLTFKDHKLRPRIYRMKNKLTGEYVWIEDHPKFLFDNQGETIGQYGTARDISERKRVENDLIIAKEKAEESDRLKSAFLANMSHEIRTPMNGIMGFAELLKEPDLMSEEKEEYIDIIRKSGKRMLNIINDIISISKVESGQMQVTITETNINEQIGYICSFFKPEVDQKKIDILYKNPLPAKHAFIKTDKEKVYAILTNLVKNAIKFTWQGYIELGCERKEEYYEFYVKDTGDGIQKDKEEVIFERFRQGTEALSRNYEGAGLGLAISKAYVEMLGGKIWVQSTLGKGSVFYFTLPFNNEKEKSIPTKKSVSPEGEAKNWNSDLKILIVEDEPISAKLLKTNLKSYAREILTAESGTEAIDICKKNPDIDLILMDIQMPEMSGYDTTYEIRKFNKQVIIIAQTAFALSGDEMKAKEAGCNDYIPKPINKDVLINMLKKHFKKL